MEDLVFDDVQDFIRIVANLHNYILKCEDADLYSYVWLDEED